MDEKTILPPDPRKPPLLVNVFSAGRSANSALLPLFPYLSYGDLVPAITVFTGGPGRDMGMFTHTNSTEEVGMVFAVAGSQLRPGDVFVGGRRHVVGGYLRPHDDLNAFMVIVVTQRQSERGEQQSETMTFACSECKATLLEYHYPITLEVPADAAPGFQLAIETVTETAAALESFNADPLRRTCSKCGHENPPFPISLWGWDAYRRNYVSTERGRSQFVNAGTKMETHNAP